MNKGAAANIDTDRRTVRAKWVYSFGTEGKVRPAEDLKTIAY